ncbi:MAG: PQQ-binding-like beta-propeller repeat protein [Acidimicrobiia bacterium]|nr:PQQ-binding-like beta-propeller repeat protein [Acidimicrobiia bacterium]
MTRRLSTAVLLVAGLVLSGLSPVGATIDGCASPDHAGGEWPVYGQSLDNDRHQELETTIGPDTVGDLAPAFTISLADHGGLGTIESTPMVADGCIFVATQSGEVFAFNADTGDFVWNTNLPGTVTTLSVANGKVFADVSNPGSPAMAALDQATGAILWSTVLTTMAGSDATGSPVAFGDKVATGTSCGSAEIESGDARLTCRGAFHILDQDTGTILATAYGIPDDDFEDGFAGGGMWSAPAIDMEDGYAYEGAGNPFSAREHPRTNAILKIDVDPNRPDTFGTVVDSYKATGEQYLPLLGTYKPLCEASGSNVGACEAPDLDMAMAVNIFHTSDGDKLVGDGQSSGIWHAVTSDTMEHVWQTVTGPPFAGARSGGSAYDGERIYTAGGAPGQVWALDPDDGDVEWVMPNIGPNVFNTMAVANDVVYTLTGGGFGGGVWAAMLAYHADSGDVLTVKPLALDILAPATGVQAGGVVIARNKVYAPVNTLAGSGNIVAYSV